ncbi:MAG: TRAP transporter substrate-binding protein [Methylobacteriaceae bacterium]|nr:TRAP transporter substrate-binding protein [Methylobacteriaceae bacterium]
MRALSKIVAAVAFCAMSAGAASAQTKWDMPTPYPDSNFHTRNVAQFVADVKAATGGALDIRMHTAGSLLKHPEIKRGVRQGTAQIGEVLISLHANESPIYGLDSVPFLVASYDDSRKLYEAQRPFLEKKLAEEGLVFLYSVPWPPQGVYAKKLIASAEDLRGLKFRTYNPGTGRIAALVGAVPVQIEVPDLPTAFATGRVEVTITSGSTGVEARFWDFVTHYHDTQAWLPRNVVFANKAAWDALSEDQRGKVKAAAKVAEDRGWEASKTETAQRIQQLKDSKMTVVAPAPAKLLEGLKAIGAQIAAEWEKSAGADGAAILAAYRK